jgi:hypothetical protein
MGRPRTDILDNLFEPYYPDPTRCTTRDQRFRCLGEGCDYSLGHPQNLARSLKHSASCSKVDDELRQAACRLLSGDSSSTKLEIALKASGSQQPLPLPTVPGSADGQKMKKPTMFELDFVNEGRKVLGLRMDLAIVKLICAGGLPPHIVDYKEWKDMLAIANKAYHPSSSTTIADNHIPKEAAKVRDTVIDFLKSNFNLTVSFDGGGTKRQQSVYTIHFTTPDGHSFLIRGEECSDESHTGEFIAQMVLKAVDLLGRNHFAGVTSDNTGNTRVARQILCAEIKTLIQVPDICHHLNLLCKDITQLQMFSGVSVG